MSIHITVYCNHQSHRGKRVEVAEFSILDGKVDLLLDRAQLDKKASEVKARMAKSGVRWVNGKPVLPMPEEDWLWFSTGKTAVVCRLCRRRLEPSDALDAAIIKCGNASPDMASSTIDMDELLGMIGN